METELAKVTRDRDLSMKKKDELTGILSQAAQALKSSLAVSFILARPSCSNLLRLAVHVFVVT